ncbi:MAG: molybdopterin molybdotransferase MoeA [Trueperaceae bacterium]|nr:MAG: molybdopterin molybdotransferase MoeA [Trueperaceae bacterium]
MQVSPLSVEQAIRSIQQQTPVGAIEKVAISESYARILAEDLASRVDHPSVDNSALDGYACRERDTLSATQDHPITLKLIGEVPAGRHFDGFVGRGQAVGIYTGAPVPRGADAIVPVEVTRESEDTVVIRRPARPSDIRPRAQDLKCGETYLRAGQELTASTLGLAAAMGYAELQVVEKPRIGILSTGDEVVEPGEELYLGQVYNANSYSLAGMVHRAGALPVLLPSVQDDLNHLENALDRAGPLDLLLTTGGVSMGKYDFVRDLLFEQGEVLFWKVAMKPGGPVLFGRWRERLVLGLPGNPVSCMVGFLLLGRAFTDGFLRRLSPLPYQQRLTATASQVFRASGFKETFQRVVLTHEVGGPMVSSTGNQSSGVLNSMATARALAVLPPHATVHEGERLEVIPLGPHL